ncbi:hypothetical protein D3C77_96690 [compost metagenome]
MRRMRTWLNYSKGPLGEYSASQTLGLAVLKASDPANELFVFLSRVAMTFVNIYVLFSWFSNCAGLFSTGCERSGRTVTVSAHMGAFENQPNFSDEWCHSHGDDKKPYLRQPIPCL